MNSPSSNDDRRRLRRELVTAEIERTAIIASEIFRWAVTSLLLLNGSALLAMVGVDELRAAFMSGPAWLFAGGILASLFSGMAAAYGFAASALGMIERLWADDALAQTTYGEFAGRAGRPGRPATTLASFFMASSALLFVLGCVELATVEPAQVQPAPPDQGGRSVSEEKAKLPEKPK